MANITRPMPEAAPAVAPGREALWRELGDAARARYEELGRLWQPLGKSEPHYHLNMIGAGALRGRAPLVSCSTRCTRCRRRIRGPAASH